MQQLKKDEMMKLIGGGISGWGVFALGTLVSFFAGVIDGFARPFACYK